MNKIVIHNLEELPVSIYEPDKSLLITTTSEIIFNDIILQIASQKLCGYYFTIDGSSHEILPDGRWIPYAYPLWKIRKRQEADSTMYALGRDNKESDLEDWINS